MISLRPSPAVLLTALLGLGALPGTAALAADATHHATAAKPAHHAGSTPAANAPKQIGKFDDWVAATHLEGNQLACYAFTRAIPPASSGKHPPAGTILPASAILTVTERVVGRDAVAITQPFLYAANASVTVQADPASFEFYTAQHAAFARDGQATVAAFAKAHETNAKSPGPHGVVTDHFSLHGFTAAYAAIIHACPPK